MLPVFTAIEMRALDARAIGELGIPGTRLMEAAGAGAARVIVERFGPVRGRRVVILCGRGNNGGDGFVVARHLRARGARVRVFLAGARRDVRGDAAWALGRVRGRVEEVDEERAGRLARELAAADVIVDALLGTGLAGPVRGPIASLIEAVNEAGRPVVALDVPSGVGSDAGVVTGPTVRATVTATFAGHKRCLVVYPAAEHAGAVVVVPIGIPPGEVARGIRTFLLERDDVQSHLGLRRADSHKGTYGHLLVVAGSIGHTGAAALAGRAALRSGAGLCTIGTAASQQPIVAALGMETMTAALPETPMRSLSLDARAPIAALVERMDAVAIGPGLSLHPDSQALARALVAEVPRPMVVDADALSALAGHLDVLREAAGPRILTPHPGEMARMLGRSVAEVQAQRVETVRDFATRYRVHVVLKGAGSCLGDPDGRVYVNPTGNPGMATGGSGDALTGMLGALLARGLAPLAALQCGVYLHGYAGDIARDLVGEDGLIAGDVVEAMPRALAEIREAPPRQ